MHPPQAALHQRVDNERERRRAAEEALATATAPRGDYDPANDDDDDDGGGFEVLEAGGASGAVMRRRGCVACAMCQRLSWSLHVHVCRGRMLGTGDRE